MKNFAMKVSESMGLGGAITPEVTAEVDRKLKNWDPSMGGLEPGFGPRVKCLHCGDVIQSKFRHDFVWCSCKSIAIDGGDAYTRFTEHKNARYKWVTCEKDLNATLVGPRDDSEDQEWCHNCEQLVLKSRTEVRETPIETFRGVEMRPRHFCKEPCQKKQ